MLKEGNLPLVSVIVITYNSSRFVLETLESVKRQTYSNIELIISDDCSIDNTLERCSKWLNLNKDFFIRTEVITVPVNTGIPANCNRGAKASNGDWLKFIAGDDILLENCIGSNLIYLKSHPSANLITSNLQFIDKDSKHIEETSDLYTGLRKHYFNLSLKEQIKSYARLPIFLNSPAFFIRKQALIDIDCFDEEFKVYEDMCLIYKFNEKKWIVHFFDGITVKYRITDSAVSSQYNDLSKEIRKNEQKRIFKKYRTKYLSVFNIIDLSVYYNFWLYYYYKGFCGIKGLKLLNMVNPYYWYMKYLNMSIG